MTQERNFYEIMDTYPNTFRISFILPLQIEHYNVHSSTVNRSEPYMTFNLHAFEKCSFLLSIALNFMPNFASNFVRWFIQQQ